MNAKPTSTPSAADPVILIVDSDARSRKRLKAALEAGDYRVVTAAGAFEGLARFGDGSGIDLVLVDHRLREMEGLAALAQMRERDPVARLVLLAEEATARLAADAVAKVGASGFLRKDCTATVLCQVVRGYLSCPQVPVSGPGILLPEPLPTLP